MVLNSWARLVGHEEVIEELVATRVEKLLRLGFFKPIVANDPPGIILDGHHKTAAAKRLGLKLVSALPVEYLQDERIAVEVWSDCGRMSRPKTELVEMAASGWVFPPETFRQVMPFSLPQLTVPLERLGRPVRSL